MIELRFIERIEMEGLAPLRILQYRQRLYEPSSHPWTPWMDVPLVKMDQTREL